MATQNDRTVFGALGESIAQQYLIDEGYELEARNWRGERGELDLIVRQNDLLVVVEVRTTSQSWLDRPAEATSLRKQKQVARCADEYVSNRPKSLPKVLDIRFDIIGLLMPPLQDGQSLNQPHPQIDHVENAYSSPWAF